MSSLRDIRRKAGRGWRFDSIRHSLAARGISTRGLSQAKLRTIQLKSIEQKKHQKILRRQNKSLLRVLEQYLLYKRKLRGMGSLYSLNDIKITRDQIIRSGDDLSIKKANDLWHKIQAYERAEFVPKIKRPKLQRAYFRAIDKMKIREPLTHLERRSLVKAEGKSFVKKLVKSGYPMPVPRQLKKKNG